MTSDASKSALDVDIEQAVKRFESAWQRGERPSIADYCQGDPSRSNALLPQLVIIDLEYRLKSGERRRVEDYLREHPQLQGDKEAILRLLHIEDRNVSAVPASTGLSLATPGDLHASDVAGQSGAASVQTAGGTGDSVLASASSLPPDSISKHKPSETLSAPGSSNTGHFAAAGTLGKFRLVDAVGHGAFGTVYRAIDTDLGRLVAIKLPKEGVLGSEKEQERFIREARSAASLRHPHIVPVYEVGGTRERPFIVSAFVSGQPLSTALAARRFEPREAAKI